MNIKKPKYLLIGGLVLGFVIILIAVKHAKDVGDLRPLSSSASIDPGLNSCLNDCSSGYICNSWIRDNQPCIDRRTQCYAICYSEHPEPPRQNTIETGN
jgi:hypothetical protein